MDMLKINPKKDDSNSKTKIPPMPKIPSRISGSTETAQSKIPKRDAFPVSVSSNGVKKTNPIQQSSVGGNKPSASMMNLNLPKATSLASSRSCANSHRSVKSNKEKTPRLENTDKFTEMKKKAEMAKIKRNLQSFKVMKEKLQNYQEQFMVKFNLVKDELPKEERDIEFVRFFKNNEGQFKAKNQPTKIITPCDKLTLEEFKTFLKNFAKKKLEELDTLDQEPRTPREIGDTFSKDREHFKQIEEAKKKFQIEKKMFLDEFINMIENLQPNNKIKETTLNKELEIKVKSLLAEVNELRQSVDDRQSELIKIKKNCEQKCCIFKKELEEKNKIQGKKQLEFDELKKKYDFLEKENLKAISVSKETGEKLTKRTHEWEDLNQKLKNCASNNVTLEAKNKTLEAKNNDLELTIDKMKIELNASENCDKDFKRDQALKHTEETNALKKELMTAQKEKENCEKEVQSLRNEIINLKNIEFKFLEIQDEIKQVNKEKQNFIETIGDLAKKLETSQNQASVSRDVQEELSRLQKVNNSNCEKIKNLQNDLTKAQFHIKSLEEKIIMDGKLLQVRKDCIDSLQSKEKSQKIRLNDLFAEVGEKNNDLQMTKTEILTKTEEFKNLFSTLSIKQMELTRQEHMIKLLQENNDRAQQLRVRQEAKIARLEEEMVELKDTISIYQDVVLPNNTLRRNLAIAEACRGRDCTDSLGFYVEERRKKRHIDINVKKYEK